MSAYLQCARISIYKALNNYKKGKSKFTTYLYVWLRGVKPDYYKYASLINIRRTDHQGLQLVDMDKSGLEAPTDYGDLEKDLLCDLSKILTYQEYTYIVKKYEGLNGKFISIFLDVNLVELRTIKTTAKFKINNYFKEKLV